MSIFYIIGALIVFIISFVIISYIISRAELQAINVTDAFGATFLISVMLGALWIFVPFLIIILFLLVILFAIFVAILDS